MKTTDGRTEIIASWVCPYCQNMNKTNLKIDGVKMFSSVCEKCKRSVNIKIIDK